MDTTSIKTGDIFYYDFLHPLDDRTHHYKCRVLFVGTESLFYDYWWDGINKWTDVPVRKRLTFSRFPLTHLRNLVNLTFDGYEAIDTKSANKLFLHSPEIILKTTKDEISKNQISEKQIEMHSETIAFIPIGPKGGWLQPMTFDTKGITQGVLTSKVLEYQNVDFIPTDNIIVHRAGLHNGVPSYIIKTQ